MGITIDDIKYYKSEVVTNLDNNGGRKSQIEVMSGIRHALFPRVTKAERIAGVTRYRKQFWTNENNEDDSAYDTLQWLDIPSNGDDRFYLKGGNQTDTQIEITTVKDWTGCGQLALALSGGETQIKLNMEADDFSFFNGEYLHISNKIHTNQVMDSNVDIGNSVLFDNSSWSKISSITDTVYPNGVCVGENMVMSSMGDTKEEWLHIADNLYSEVIGIGDATTEPSLNSLSNIVNGLCTLPEKCPIVTTVDESSNTLTAVFDSDGALIVGSSNASVGELNMSDGTWVLPIIWDTAPGSGEDINIEYRDKPYSYSGNTVTIDLDDPVTNIYTITKTYASGCIFKDEVRAFYDNIVKSSSSGIYDETSFPIKIHNAGAEEDTITIQFTSGTVFTVSGATLGVLGTGFSVTSDCVPVNPSNGAPMFTLDKDGWSGTWAINDTIIFDLHPSAKGIWLKEVVPAATAQEPNNLIILGWYSE